MTRRGRIHASSIEARNFGNKRLTACMGEFSRNKGGCATEGRGETRTRLYICDTITCIVPN